MGKSLKILEANIKALKAGELFGEVSEIFVTKYEVPPAPMSTGTYRGIMGSHAIVLGLDCRIEKGGNPIVLWLLSNYTCFGYIAWIIEV